MHPLPYAAWNLAQNFQILEILDSGKILQSSKNNGLLENDPISRIQNPARRNLEFASLFQRLIAESRIQPVPTIVGVQHTDVCEPPMHAHGLPTPSPLRTDQPCILALDLGTHTGWAVQDSSGSIASGTEGFTPHRFEGGGMRYLRFKQWLTELKATLGGLQAVYFEEVRRHKGVDAAHTYGGFMAHLTAWCEHHSIPYQGIPVGTIKKFITGTGNANKQAVIDAVRKRGFTPANDNEADALALLTFILTQHRRNQ